MTSIPRIDGVIGDIWQLGLFITAAGCVMLWRRKRRLGVAFGVAFLGLLALGGTGWL